MENIVLCGFMGSGKSTIGKMLSNTLDMPLIDTDEYIEKKLNMSIPQIFAEKGENFFRQTELEVCRELSALSGYIISTGGGTLLKSENVSAVKQSGTVFFLNVSEEAVLYRLRNDTSRPLLQREDKKDAVHKLMTERLPLYKRAADFIIDAEQTPKKVCEQITELFCGGTNGR